MSDFEESVKAVVEKMAQDDKGNWTLPNEADIPKEVMYAARLEKRFRDTQGSFTKASQKAKELEITNQKLTEHLVANATLHLTDNQAHELEQLKRQDIDAWRTKVNEYESQAKSLLQTKAREFHTEAQKATELEQRKARTEQFAAETGIAITDDLIATRLPAKVARDLEAGVISFETFLAEVKQYVKPDNIAGANKEPEKDIDLAKLPGGAEPAAADKMIDDIQAYRNEVY
jgi:hypothetical protein